MRERSITTIQWCSWVHQNDFSANKRKNYLCWISLIKWRWVTWWSAMKMKDGFGTTEVSVLVLAFSFCLHFCDIFITTSIKRNLQLAIGIAAGHLVKQSAVVRKFVKPLDSGRLTMLTWMCEKRRFRTSKLTIGGAVFWWTLAHWKFRQFLAQLVTSRIC